MDKLYNDSKQEEEFIGRWHCWREKRGWSEGNYIL
jgi:hypothetical protein